MNCGYYGVNDCPSLETTVTGSKFRELCSTLESDSALIRLALNNGTVFELRRARLAWWFEHPCGYHVSLRIEGEHPCPS
jgi:hypothetical protein